MGYRTDPEEFGMTACQRAGKVREGGAAAPTAAAPCGAGPSRNRSAARQARGATAFHAGWSAEEQVARHYDGMGETVCQRRWRGSAGEIDLVARNGDRVIFVEVKQSHSHDAALARLGPRQMQRIWNAASEFLAGEPRGQLTEVRLDIALVDGIGRVKVIRDAWIS